MKTLLRVIGIAFGLAAVLSVIAVVALWHEFEKHSVAGGCDSDTISQAISEDRAWRALVREEVCQKGRLRGRCDPCEVSSR